MTAHYEIVSSGMTGHAESVEITFDPAQISYAQLLARLFHGRARSDRAERQGP